MSVFSNKLKRAPAKSVPKPAEPVAEEVKTHTKRVSRPIKAVPKSVNRNSIYTPKLDIIELIQRRRRQLIIHSVIYYRLNNSVISDAVFDSWCNELVELQKVYSEEARIAPFYEEFKDFDGSTGYHLIGVGGTERSMRVAEELIATHTVKLQRGEVS